MCEFQQFFLLYSCTVILEIVQRKLIFDMATDEPLLRPPACGSLDLARTVKNHLQRFFRRCDEKRLAPSSLDRDQPVLQALWLPGDTSVGYIAGALPGGVVVLMNAQHTQKSYIFFEEKKVEKPTAKPVAAGKPDPKTLQNTAKKGLVEPKDELQATTAAKEVDDDEEERRRCLNALAVAKASSGRGYVFASAYQGAVVTYHVPDPSARSFAPIMKADGHTRVLPFPTGSWKRLAIVFNPIGDAAVVALRPSSAAGDGAASSIAVIKRQGGARAGDAAFVALTGWSNGPRDIVEVRWLDNTMFFALTTHGAVECFKVDDGTKSIVAIPEAKVELALLGQSVTSACCAPTQAQADGTLGTSVTVCTSEGILTSFRVALGRKRTREGSWTAPQLDTVIPLSSTYLRDFTVQSLSFAFAMTNGQPVPLVVVALETGAICFYHATTLEMLHVEPYSRRCKDSANSRLQVVARDKVLQLCCWEDEIVSILKGA